ncbi:MAG: UDP-N-acetylmuramoyl-L-alanyl-D-glutamate--2,6-diaminopimelate ligase, partial [Anaerolineae bacterium]|nr:UDP-N-acetylmuramoyl-L-alanyl-D-glutamate--2,6-diaminopimelate ligase [Anaerolineae bacterium]
MVTFSQLLAHLPSGDLLSTWGDTNIPITAPIAESTSAVEKGGIFVARKGKSVDGHDFIPQAIMNGAVAIVGEKPIDGLTVPYAQVRDSQSAIGILSAAYYDFPARKMTVIGVTG